MKYNLSSPLDRDRFDARAAMLRQRGCFVELTELRPRTGAQNRYLHLVIGVVAMEMGVSVDYAKQEYFKRLVNPQIFVKEVDDRFRGRVQLLLSSRDVTAEQMSEALDRFKKWATENGIYIPEPGDEQRLLEIEVELGRMQRYM